MRKLYNLFINELIKNVKKISVLVMLIIMVVCVLGIGSIIKFSEYMNKRSLEMNNSSSTQKSDYWKDQIKNEITNMENQLSLNSQQSGEIIYSESPEIIKIRIEMYKKALEKDINVFSTSYKAQAINSIINYKTELLTLSAIPLPEKNTTDRKTLLEGFIVDLNKAIDNSSIADYVKVKNEEVKASNISDEEKQIEYDVNALRIKYNIAGNQDMNGSDSAEFMLDSIKSLKTSLLNNIDYTIGTIKPLTPQNRIEAENKLAVNLYKLDKSISDTTTTVFGIDTAVSGMMGVGIFIMIILLIILGGSAISQEISTGSIKSIIISPAKRWKIFLSKVLAIFTIGVFAAIILYIVTMLFSGLLFGFKSGQPYIYAVNGMAHGLNFYLYKFIYLFINFTEVIIFMIFALMLSTVTRNTAASVGISMAVYFGGNVAVTFIAFFFKGEWVKFIPFVNFGIADRLFASSTLNQASMGSAGMNNILQIPVIFSVFYLAVLFICLFYTALDSFNRREIK